MTRWEKVLWLIAVIICAGAVVVSFVSSGTAAARLLQGLVPIALLGSSLVSWRMHGRRE